jgi:hypothetical protein
MPSDHPTDDQIIAEEARLRRVIITFLVSFVLLITAAGLLLLAARTQIIPVWLSNVLVIALFLAWLGFILFRVKPSNPTIDLTDASYLRKTIDRRQRYARYMLLYWLAIIIGTGFLLSHVILQITKRPPFPFGLVVSFGFVIVVLLGVLQLAYGPRPFSLKYDLAGSDELSRAQRAQATQLGYVFTVMEFCGLQAATAYHPQWGFSLLPAAIATAVAVPGFYLLFLEWRAGRSDD